MKPKVFAGAAGGGEGGAAGLIDWLIGGGEVSLKSIIEDEVLIDTKQYVHMI